MTTKKKCSSGKPIADHYPLRCSHECDGGCASAAKTFAEVTKKSAPKKRRGSR